MGWRRIDMGRRRTTKKVESIAADGTASITNAQGKTKSYDAYNRLVTETDGYGIAA